jgi:hypothetical protein
VFTLRARAEIVFHATVAAGRECNVLAGRRKASIRLP